MDPKPRVSDILHRYIRKDHLKVSIIPAIQVSGRAFTELQKNRGEVMSLSQSSVLGLSQIPRGLTHRAFLFFLFLSMVLLFF